MPVRLSVTLVIRALNLGTPMDGRGTISTHTHTHTHIHAHECRCTLTCASTRVNEVVDS